MPHRICYAVKANGNGAILRLLAALGAGADIVSGGELLAALRAGFPPERIVFAGVGKTDAEIALGLEHGIGEWNAESEDEIAPDRRRGGLARRRSPRVSLRVNPDIDPRSHPYISTGLREAKFGVDIAPRPRDPAPGARARPGSRSSGVQCHIGSQITDLEPLAAAARALAGLSRQLLDEGFALRTIDLGGGLGRELRRDGRARPVGARGGRPARRRGAAAHARARAGAVAGGRRPASLLTRVLYVKGGPREDVRGRGRGHERPAAARPLRRLPPRRAGRARAGEPRELVDVVGPVCETSDFLARRRELERPEPGDLLAVRDAGAYGFAMSSNYNMRPRAAEVLVEDGRVRLIRRRETFEDLVRTEV